MKYDDIINLPHHVSRKHPHMSMTDRAAQFSPFMALVGFGGEVKEAQRLTDRRIELDDNKKELLNEKLLILAENLPEQPFARITYFTPDVKKEGGRYVLAEGHVKRIDPIQKSVALSDGRIIFIEDIIEIELE